MGEQLFQTSQFPLGLGGQIAQGLSDSGGLRQTSENIANIIGAVKQNKLLNTKLSDLGIDDAQALVYGATAKGKKTPSEMTLRELQLVRTAGGDAAGGKVSDIFGADIIKGTPLETLGAAPWPVAAKFGQVVKPSAGGSSPAKVYVSKKQQAKYNATGKPEDMPRISMVPTGDPDEVAVDTRSSAQYLRQADQMLSEAKQADLNQWRTLMAGKFKSEEDAQIFNGLLKQVELWQGFSRAGLMTDADQMRPAAMKAMADAKTIMEQTMATNKGNVPTAPGLKQKNPFPAVVPQPTPSKLSLKPAAPAKPAFVMFGPDALKGIQKVINE